MFSFHKPKIYRSNSGCCICKAKSSSSRFTDSKKYEAEFEKCFRIDEKRSGEICNACVLLVKRWKKLPSGTNKDWNHVVDARAGPGTKSFKNNASSGSYSKTFEKKRCFSKPVRNNKDLAQSSSSGSEFDEDEDYEMDSSLPPLKQLSGINNTRGSSKLFNSRLVTNKLNTRQVNDSRRKRRILREEKSSFIDPNYWKKEKTCCGIIFKGLNNEVMIFPELFRPCKYRLRQMMLGRNGNHKLSISTESVESSESSTSHIQPNIFSPMKSEKELVFTKKKLSSEFNENSLKSLVDDVPSEVSMIIQTLVDMGSEVQTNIKPQSNYSVLTNNKVENQNFSSTPIAVSDENSMHDFISEDRLSTISSSLLENDDYGSTSSSSEIYEDTLHHHRKIEAIVKSNRSSTSTPSLTVI